MANVNALAPILAITPLAVAAIPLPLGISFFTFHAISYVVDVYKRNAHAERNLPRFALYILLFPQLIAGPDHPLARHRARSCPRASSAWPTSRTACAASCSASARRC